MGAKQSVQCNTVWWHGWADPNESAILEWPKPYRQDGPNLITWTCEHGQGAARARARARVVCCVYVCCVLCVVGGG